MVVRHHRPRGKKAGRNRYKRLAVLCVVLCHSLFAVLFGAAGAQGNDPKEVGNVNEVCLEHFELKRWNFRSWCLCKQLGYSQKFTRFVFVEISVFEREFKEGFLSDLGEIRVRLNL